MPNERDSPYEITSKHRKNGDYTNHYFHTPGNAFIGLIQKQGNTVVYEDCISYDSPDEARKAFLNL